MDLTATDVYAIWRGRSAWWISRSDPDMFRRLVAGGWLVCRRYSYSRPYTEWCWFSKTQELCKKIDHDRFKSRDLAGHD